MKYRHQSKKVPSGAGGEIDLPDNAVILGVLYTANWGLTSNVYIDYLIPLDNPTSQE